MNFNDAMERALAQARDMQRQIGEAVNQAAEEMKPRVEQSLKDAQDLQSTLSRHATQSGETAAAQAQTALGHLNAFVRMGSDAMRESAEQTRATALKMVDESRKVVESVSAVVNRRDGAGPPPSS